MTNGPASTAGELRAFTLGPAGYTFRVTSKPYFAPRFRIDDGAGDPRVVALPVPGFRQVRGYTCGYACALMVLRYFDPTVDGQALYRRLGTGRDGTRQTAIIRELRAAGVAANARYDVDFSRLRTAIDRGKLVIAYHFKLEHWIVLYGYGLGPARVFVADPRPQEPCEHAWTDYRTHLRGFGIICSVREARDPAPANDESAVQLSFEF